MMPDYPNGVTREMMEAGTEVLLRAKYVGVAFASGSDKSLVMETPSAIACALARAYPRWRTRRRAAAGIRCCIQVRSAVAT
jgi:hypothetical protein